MIEFLIAESAINQLHARYVDALWRKDAEAFAECFASDAEWKIAGMHMCGRTAIGGLFEKLVSSCERVRMILSTPILSLQGGAAIGRIHVTEFARLRDGGSAMNLGTYYDRYIDEGDQWRFTQRYWTLHYRGPIDLSAAFVDAPDYGPHPGMPGLDEPTLPRSGS